MTTRSVDLKLTVTVPDGTSDTQVIQALQRILAVGHEQTSVYRGHDTAIAKQSAMITLMKYKTPKVLKP